MRPPKTEEEKVRDWERQKKASAKAVDKYYEIRRAMTEVLERFPAKPQH